MATVRAESQARQGARDTTTDQAGAYRLTGLAPGDYTVTIEFAGLQSVVHALRVGVGVTEVNAVTKRGGNLFSGSVRSNLSNAAWTDETPFEVTNKQKRPSKMDRYCEGTVGGPIRRDRVWCFFAGRTQSSETTLTLAYYRNSDAAVRDYQAMKLQGHCRLRSNWSVVG